MASSPSSSPKPTALAAAASRRPPPPCWTHDETLALIHAYSDKWLALRRANLRSADWDAVADSVSAATSSLPASTPKTSVQCRHKVEKLRKRFRGERLRSLKRNPNLKPYSSWPYYDLLDAIDFTGPAPPLPLPTPPPPPAATAYPSSSVSSDREEHRYTLKKRRRFEEEEGEVEGMGEMAKALRAVGEGFVRMEERRMEVARELGRMRMEMDLWRTQMMLDVQRRLMDGFVSFLEDA